MFWKPWNYWTDFPARSLSGFLGAAIALGLLGWGQPIRAGAGTSSSQLEQLRVQELRVASVTYRLALANRASCTGSVGPQPGFALHGIEQYEPADREKVRSTFGLGEHPGIIAVIPNSPAERAGLRPDDQLLAINGLELGAASLDLAGRPTRAAIERAQAILLEELGKGTVSLQVASAGRIREIRFTPELGCTTNVELMLGDAANAWADGERIVIGAGLLASCETDDDLALVIAHELAHNLLKHGHGALRGGDRAGMREDEEEADRLAVSLVAAAGYDLSGAEDFMKGLLVERAASSAPGTHPATTRRLGLLRAEVAVAQGKTAAR